MKATKRPARVEVRFAATNGVVQTLEGPVAYEAGDALLRGARGERWPIRRDVFSRRYLPVEGVSMFEDGEYVKGPLVVEAERMDARFSLRLENGSVLSGRAGDWLLTGPDGEQWVVSAEIFDATYET